MKKLVRIKLINWYTFRNVTIDIEGNTLISGENGSGKSTLLDAIQYVLTAGNAKFNKAADDKSKRTLETYVRGKTGLEDKAYLRAGDVTSYICLEFLDNKTRRRDLIGAVISAPLNGRINREFFKITGMEINDSIFTINNMLKTINEFKKEKYVETFDSKQSISRMIKSVLGLTSDKYFDLINKALAYKPISKLHEFVYEFLLPEDNINLENLQNNINSLNELEKIIQKEEEKITALEEIEKSNNLYQEMIKEEKRLEYIKKSLIILDKKEKIENIFKNITKETKKREDLGKELDLLTIKIDKIKEEISLYDKSLNGDNKIDLYKELDSRVRELRNENIKLIEKKNNFMKTLKEEISLFKGFTWVKLDGILKDENINKDKILENHQLKIEEVKQSKLIESHKLGLKKGIVLEEFNKADEKLKYLNKSEFCYDYAVMLLTKTIKERLKDKYKLNVEVRPLCEYLTITNDTWRNAIEGYLNKQRFDLIIEPKYFDEAVKIYDELKVTNKIHGVGIVNTNKLEELDINENTLATLVKASNIYAERYMLKLLNNVYLAKNSLDLKNYNRAITKEGMTYINHVVRNINPKIYEDKFIGEKALEEQVEKFRMVYDNNKNLLNEINVALKELEKEKDKLNKSNIIELRNNVSILDKVKLNEEELVKLENELKEFEKDKILFDKIEKRKISYNRLNELENEYQNIVTSKSEINVKIEQLNEEKESLEDELSILESNLEIEDSYTIQDENLANIDDKIMKNSNLKVKNGTLIEESLKDFNEKFDYDEVASINNIDKYLNTLFELRVKDIVKHKSKSIELKELCKKSFREDFIIRLRDKIETAKEEIKALNRGLKSHQFGHERYEFIIKRSEDNEFGKYYDIITSGADYSLNTLFSESLTNEQYDELEGLFYKLMNSDSETLNRKIVDTYTDYRNYLSYDIKITNDEFETYYFSNVLNEKSGGETQTPFYVIIASSFENLLKFGRRNDDIGCVVLFDEAFNNMDEARIEAMMNFYAKELNIQLIISVPDNKISTIVPYVDTTLLIAKRNYVSSISRIVNTNDYFE